MRDASEISTASYKDALSALWREGKISENHMTWLKAHYHAPNQVITATELAEMVGYDGHGGVNLWYGELGKLVAEKVGYQKPEGYTFLSTLVTFEKEATPFPMKLRPNLTQALKELSWVLIDLTTEFGRRVAKRLAEERIIWLTTIDAAGVPQPKPVWFWWDGQTFLIYSQPNTRKLQHIGRNPKVALNLDGDGQGGNIVVFTGEAHLAPDMPPANEVPAYAQKYQPGVARIGMSAEQFAQTYSVALKVTPTHLRGH